MTNFVKKVVSLSEQEWKFFGQRTMDKNSNLIRKGMSETDDGFWQRVGIYWQALGKDITGKNTDYPWSAAFISYIMKMAGAEDNFQYSAAHATYIRKAIKDVNKTNAAFKGFPINNYSPQIGDLVGYAREFGIHYDNLPSFFKSHCDIVVGVRKNEIDVIGGNVGNSVTKKTLVTDNNGLVIDKQQTWFVVLQNNL